MHYLGLEGREEERVENFEAAAQRSFIAEAVQGADDALPPGVGAAAKKARIVKGRDNRRKFERHHVAVIDEGTLRRQLLRRSHCRV